MAGGNKCVVNTLPSICEQLTICYFQETNQIVCVKYAIISSLGFSRRYFRSMRGYSSYWVVQRSKKTLYHTMSLNSYKSYTVTLEMLAYITISVFSTSFYHQYLNFIKIYNRPNPFSKIPFCIKTYVNME